MHNLTYILTRSSHAACNQSSSLSLGFQFNWEIFSFFSFANTRKSLELHWKGLWMLLPALVRVSLTQHRWFWHSLALDTESHDKINCKFRQANCRNREKSFFGGFWGCFDRGGVDRVGFFIQNFTIASHWQHFIVHSLNRLFF